jgi:hypothetical protein
MHRARWSGKRNVHLRWGFGARDQLEDDPHAVEGFLLPGAGDVDGRREQRHGAREGRDAKADADLAGGPGGMLAPYMYMARRVISVPAYTFSETACSMNPAGARMGHRRR